MSKVKVVGEAGLDEQAKAQLTLTAIPDKKQARRALRNYKTVKSKGKPKIVEAQPFACSVCGKTPSKPIAPPGIWLCAEEHYFPVVMAQLYDKAGCYFLNMDDLAVYRSTIELLGEFGAALPSDEVLAKMDEVGAYTRNARLFTNEHGQIWYGDTTVRLVDQLEKRLGVSIFVVGEEVESVHRPLAA